ncbi:sugar phosphate isomerase/epimerase family protein [Phaeovulum sp.]|uniref:sugar phosphate isomerase/epimerase family protein n=1 Tax=Phaeovulum sp. TaxID=2934796 RepID=UPI0039E24810
MPKDLPVLGVALSLDMLALHRNWIMEKQRDIEIQSFCWPMVQEDDITAMTPRAKALLDGHTGRVGLHGPFMSFSIDCADPLITEVIRARMLRTLQICEDLGADQMVVHSPYTTWDDANNAINPSAAHIQVERTRYVMDPVIKRAEDAGVTLVIENVEDKNPHDRVALARALNSPKVKVSLDTGHAHYAHGTTGAPPVDVFVRAAGAALEHVHLQDADGYADRHWHPGQGTINWHAVFAALAELPKHPRLILEVNDERGIRRGADHLIGLGVAL